jgi:hypothetical protein
MTKNSHFFDGAIIMKIDWDKLFFYQYYEEGEGTIRAWVLGVIIVAIILVGGYVEGLEQTNNLGNNK